MQYLHHRPNQSKIPKVSWGVLKKAHKANLEAFQKGMQTFIGGLKAASWLVNVKL